VHYLAGIVLRNVSFLLMDGLQELEDAWNKAVCAGLTGPSDDTPSGDSDSREYDLEEDHDEDDDLSLDGENIWGALGRKHYPPPELSL
jgi:hypothetical protein